MKSLELFAGIGGISLAAEWAGIETAAFCEQDPFCQKVLNKHWADVPIFDDVKTLNKQVLEEGGVDVGAIKLISGGYPCQPYSYAGDRKGEEDDRFLWPEVKRLLQEIRPTWFVGENVAGHINLGLDKVLFDLESIHYSWQSFILPASSVGANHERYRVFVVAHANSIRDNTKKERRTYANREKEMQQWTFAQLGSTDNIDYVCHANSQSKPQENKKVSSIRSRGETREGSSRKYRGTSPGKHWEINQPAVCRMDDGLSKRLDKSRLKALGNAVVPQQIYPKFEAIMKSQP